MSPRYTQQGCGGRSRYRDRSQGCSYNPPPGQYEYHQQEQHQYNIQSQQYDLHHNGLLVQQPPWPHQQPTDGSSHQMYDAPHQYYWGPQQQHNLLSPPAGPYIASNGIAAVQYQSYASATPLPQLPPPSYHSSGARPCITHKRFSGENMSPFVRAHVPKLEREHQTSAHDLIVLIDGFNEAFFHESSPPGCKRRRLGPLDKCADGQRGRQRGCGYRLVRDDKGAHEETGKMLEAVGLLGVGGGQEMENVFLRQQCNEAFSHPIMQGMSALGDGVMALSFDGVEEATMHDGFWKKWGAKEARKAEQNKNEKMMKEQARQDRRVRRRAERGSSRRQEKETKKILWIVIAGL
ncbi:hypothetical protein BJY01DRAFT_253719 [Aspergillus pseudoustus]|uniref:Uncharacterized protein n=1 Tax=Aspergillus pseudoustus TaxID=1810923 RepID=A0ABR4IYG2_9EURO